MPRGLSAEFGTVSTFVAMPISRLTSARAPSAWSCVAVTLDWAKVTAVLSPAESTVARTVPTLTRSPTATGIEVTAPVAPKERSALWAGSRVPVAETLSRMVLVVALTRVGAAASEAGGCVTDQAPKPPTTSRAVATPTMAGRLLNASALNLDEGSFRRARSLRASRRLAQETGRIMNETCEGAVLRCGSAAR